MDSIVHGVTKSCTQLNDFHLFLSLSIHLLNLLITLASEKAATRFSIIYFILSYYPHQLFLSITYWIYEKNAQYFLI